MRTDELEGLLRTALHEDDARPVAITEARRHLALREQNRRSHPGRWLTAALVAAALVLVVVASTALKVLVDREAEVPVTPSPRIVLSPSGLPVGLLETVALAGNAPFNGPLVRFAVRRDGTGTFLVSTTGGVPGGFPVTYARVGPGLVEMRYENPKVCADPVVLRMTYTVRGRDVFIHDATSSGCVVPAGDADLLTGSTLRVRPFSARFPDREKPLAPSGLPVGLYQAALDLTSDVGPPPQLWLLVRDDGSGDLRIWRLDGPVEGETFGVTIMGSETPGQVLVRYDAAICGDSALVMTIDFTRDADSVTFEDVRASGSCVVSPETAAALTGLTITVQPLPGTERRPPG